MWKVECYAVPYSKLFGSTYQPDKVWRVRDVTTKRIIATRLLEEDAELIVESLNAWHTFQNLIQKHYQAKGG